MKVHIKRKTTFKNCLRRQRRRNAVYHVIYALLALTTCCGITADAGICFKIFFSDSPINTLRENIMIILIIAIVTATAGAFVSQRVENMLED